VRIHSFRFRIALFSVLLAGSAVIGFGLVSWWLIYDAKLKRLDGEIKSQLLRESAPPRPINHWESYDMSLSSVFGVAPQAAIALLVIDPEGNTLYQSDHWSGDLKNSLNFPNLPPDQRSPADDLPPPPPPNRGLPPPPDSPEGFPPAAPPDRDLPGLPPASRPNPPGHLGELVTHHTLTATWRVGTVASPFVRIGIAVNLQAIDQEMNTIRNGFLIVVPTILLLVAIGAWMLSGHALKPLREVTTTIRNVTASGLDQRLPIAAVDGEFMELVRVFNQMLERLERSFKQASRFSADAAHELKTPLAILQGELERSLHQVEAGSEVQQRLSRLLDEVRHLGAIVRKLLLLSLADAGQMRLHLVDVNLSQLLMDLLEDLDLLAPNLTLKSEILPDLAVRADRDLLIQVVQNLISNAVKYNLPEGWIEITTRRTQNHLSITISNASQGIPVCDRDRIFDRFYRGNTARNRQTEGLGLGLSLSREIVRAHGGELALAPSPPHQTTFTLTLPTCRGLQPLSQG